MQAARREWAVVWERFEGVAGAPWRECPDHIVARFAPLPPLIAQMLRACASTFKKHTGVGGDSIHPRTFGWLTDEALSGVADLLSAVESTGLWPRQIAIILIALIPKPEGGKRPVGILRGLVRLWERVRRPIVELWRVGVARSYNWAAKGRSPQDAACMQAFKAEAAAAKGLSAAAGMLDLVKAFEMVRLELVWARGLELGFPITILRATLEAFSFARRLMLDGAVSAPVDTLSAILAGGGFATDAMLIALIKPCDTIAKELPAADICLFVDDLNVLVVGKEEVVKDQLVRALSRSIDLLEGDLLLRVSSKKTFVIASSRALAKQMKPKVGRLGIGIRTKAKLLGVDFSCGKRVSRVVQASRVQSVVKRKARYKKLGKKAAGRLVRTGAAPAMQYGASVYGTPDTTLKAVRGFACAVRGEMRGRSTFARLEIARYDPGAICATAPIVDWAKAVWDGFVAADDLRAVWKNAHCLTAGRRSPFRHVAGPGGAMLASCMRLGWRCPSFDKILKKDGTSLDLTVVCPMQVRLHALQALRRHEAGKSSLALRIGGPPDLEPLSDYLCLK